MLWFAGMFNSDPQTLYEMIVEEVTTKRVLLRFFVNQGSFEFLRFFLLSGVLQAHYAMDIVELQVIHSKVAIASHH